MSITVFGEGRGFRVIWLLEEMGLPYRLRPVNLVSGIKDDLEFLMVNPSGFIPALVDGDVTMVESIAIMEYLIARYGPTPLAPNSHDVAFPLYQQFLHLGEAGLMGFLFMVFADRELAPESSRNSCIGGLALKLFESRRSLLTRQLMNSTYCAGEMFTAADISVTYSLEFAKRNGGIVLNEAEQAYITRATSRDAYARATETCQTTRPWLLHQMAGPNT